MIILLPFDQVAFGSIATNIVTDDRLTEIEIASLKFLKNQTIDDIIVHYLFFDIQCTSQLWKIVIQNTKNYRGCYIYWWPFLQEVVYFFNMSNSSFFNGDKLTRWAWKEKGMVGFGLFWNIFGVFRVFPYFLFSRYMFILDYLIFCFYIILALYEFWKSKTQKRLLLYMGGDNNSITSQCQATNTMIEAKMCSLTEKLGRGNTLK